jgi:excinuclease ABC subunit A
VSTNPSHTPADFSSRDGAAGQKAPSDAGLIIIRGARQHNLKNINLDIPRNTLTIITGLSGSGKSSLAFDTIYAEGQRRYVESLSSYARQFLGQMDKPDVDLIEGLSPAISIEQKSTNKNPRSTVGTVTEIHDYLRLLFSKIGEPHCHKCGRPINSQSAVDIVDKLLALPMGTKLMLLSPLVDSRKGEHQKLFDRLRKDGFTRVRVGGELQDLGQPINLDKRKKHQIEVVVDRLIIKEGLTRRLTDSVELALRSSEGIMIAAILDDDLKTREELFFSQNFACDYCGISFPELTPQLFSFNAPQGACPECGGLGSSFFFDTDLVLDYTTSISKGAILPWDFTRNSHYSVNLLGPYFKKNGWDVDAVISSLPKQAIDFILYGNKQADGRQAPSLEYKTNILSGKDKFDGVINELQGFYQHKDSEFFRPSLAKYMRLRICPGCNSARLRPESLAVTISGTNIHSLCTLPVAKCLDWFIHIDLNDQMMSIARLIIKEIRERLGFLNDVGLGYLSLARKASSLSGGESQRIRLASQLGSKLVGVMYVLDEPSIGLHQRDNEKLLASLKRIRNIGNSVIIVEHDAETILSADHVVDLGPGAGESGGRIIFEGTPEQLLKDSASLTGQYLSGKKVVSISRRRRTSRSAITITGARANNLKNLAVSFPLGVFTVVTGVSGSGKSSLVLETLQKAVEQKIYRNPNKPVDCDSIGGTELIDKVIDIDQSPIGRTPRSNPATYIGIFNIIRDLFSQLPEARARGYTAGRFSFNRSGGRCEKCQGDGIIKIEMHFLPDVYVRCEACQGRRYNRDTLEIKYAGASIDDVLDMTVSQAAIFFDKIPALRENLQTLEDVGLGYIRLGQSATTLSGGEAQRIKLSKELTRRSTGSTLYILDEPTTGLHFDDVKKLLEVLQKLVNQGNTVIVIEHNLDIIKNADHLIDLGPEGGDAGGMIVAQGTPEQVAATPGSHTGRFLKQILKGHRQ